MTSPLLSSSPVTALSGVGKTRAKALKGRGIVSVRDLIALFPRDYKSMRLYPVSAELCGRWAGFEMTVDTTPTLALLPGRRRLLKFSASDEASTRVTVYYFNQPYLRNQIFKGDRFAFYGELREKNGVFSLFSPERFTEIPSEDALTPVYPAIPGFSSKTLSKIIREALRLLADPIEETLPQEVLSRFALPGRAEMIRTLHTPETEEKLHAAQGRLTFERYFSFGLELNRFQSREKKEVAPGFAPCDWNRFFARFPYELTSAQKRAIREIEADLVSPGKIPLMNRLLQGDVGSGKTAVAAAAAYLCASNGGGTLLMAPTEILARQHFKTFTSLFQPLGIPVFLLTGSTLKREREEIFQETCGRGPYVLIGTHALIEDAALCKNVRLAVTDEQHRFGVNQRSRLREKGSLCHTLLMSATPIPRSLALFLYAPEEISVLDELPPGRQSIDTFYVGEDKKARVYAFLKEKLSLGQRAFVVCPLIDPNEEMTGLLSAAEAYQELRKEFGEFGVGFLHGKMKNAEKNEVMTAFQKGEIRLLVSTTVIEVGVDVPEATVMVVFNAERFGLSQLHQLRGRVGRGRDKSACILLSASSAKSARERLKMLCDTSDGFKLAQYDLKTRGPGEFFGERQSGFAFQNLEELSLEFARDAILAAKEFPDLLPQKTLQY